MENQNRLFKNVKFFYLHYKLFCIEIKRIGQTPGEIHTVFFYLMNGIKFIPDK